VRRAQTLDRSAEVGHLGGEKDEGSANRRKFHLRRGQGGTGEGGEKKLEKKKGE